MIFRIFKIVFTLLPHVIKYPFRNIGYIKENYYKNLIQSFIYLGPFWIKFGQWMAMRQDIFSKEFIDNASLLHNLNFKEGYSRGAIGTVRKIIDHDYPFALKEKIKENDILIRQDINIVLYLAKISQYLSSSCRKFNIYKCMKEFETSLLNQMDFLIEIKNSDKLKENFINWENVEFPASHPDWNNTSDVYCMYWEDGELLSELIKNNSLSKKDKSFIAETLIKVFLKMTFQDGFLHADMHPGNIIIRKSYKESEEYKIDEFHNNLSIIIIDTGLCYELDECYRKILSDLFMSFIYKDYSNTTEQLWNQSQTVDKLDKETLDKMKKELVSHFQNVGKSSFNDVDVGKSIFEAMNIMKNYNIRFEPKFSCVIMASIIIDGLARTLDKSCKFVDIAIKYFA